MKYRIDKSLWKTDDKEWMAQRKEEWKYISKSLDVIRNEPNSAIKKKLFKYHKELFLTGEYNLSKEDELNFEQPFPSDLFYLWYCPDRSLEAYKDILNSHLNSHIEFLCRKKSPPIREEPREYSLGIRKYFMSVSSNIGFDPEYGFMGGREELLVQTLFPSKNYDDVLKITDENGDGEAVIHIGPKPEDLYKLAVSAIYPMFEGKDKCCYHPSKYMWSYLDYGMQKQPDCLGRLGTEVLVYVLYILKHTDEFEDFPKDTKHVVEFANKLRSQFEKNEFGDVLMGYWNNAEKLYAEYMAGYEE